MKLCLTTIAAFALVGASADALAAGVLIDSAELPAKTASSLRSDIDHARVEVPELFKAVHDIASRANELDAAARKPGTPLTMQFKSLGPRALMPMLEMLAFDAHAPTGLTPTASSALQVGLVEAIGIVRDARAVPVLGRVLERERSADVTRAAADALGRIGTDEAFTALTRALELSKTSIDRESAVLAGLGSCRRADAARLLAKRLDAHPDDATARVVAKALGTIGNAWAWQTLSARSEEGAVRETAARSLVNAYLTYRGSAQKAVSNAILVVDDPHTAALVEAAKRGASRDVVALLDALSQRLLANPTHANYSATQLR
ncbi:hypothetical protein AKJ09_00898 [Labilithrix luteola]|uniref:HEAT repeat domain-containing protein n=1 Tax=Labilithrix luteola TaxID=1391654 RepID=A0A0K1PMB9_9BACT|nr:HEAT repeat domain-containing protein [Labilithrix luteola]AKU94234.1 hypothetical protein AKJ09_00898 [Labilithrix luteola]